MSLEYFTASRTGEQLQYSVYQIEGQKYAMIQDGTEAPPGNCEVYVSNLPRDAPIHNVLDFFLQSGDIHLLRLLMDFSGYNRGKCFILFKNIRASREAICLLNEALFANHVLVVKLSLNNNLLIFKSIPVWIHERYLWDLLVNCFGSSVKNVSMKLARIPYKQYCFCWFKDHSSAAKAHKKIWPYLNLDGNVVDVHWAVPQITRSARNLYFTNFPKDLGKKEFFEIVASEIDLVGVVQIRFSHIYGSITFLNLKALECGERRLRKIYIRGYQLKFSKMPFGPRGVDRTSEEFFRKQALTDCYPSKEEPNQQMNDNQTPPPFYDSVDQYSLKVLQNDSFGPGPAPQPA